MLIRYLLAPALAAGIAASAPGQIRVVSYNVAGLNGNLTALQDVFDALMVDDKPGFATAPAILVFQETQSADTNPILSMLNAAAPSGVTYVRATFTSSSGEDSASGAQALYYRQGVVFEDPAGHQDIPTGAGRNADRWLLRLAGYTSPAARIYVYSCHFKAGNTASDETDRAAGATALRNNASSLPAGSNIVYVGDFNVYHNTEQAYLILTAAGSARGNDPYGTGSWAVPPSSNAIKHTQSPCATGCSLVSGGMDDRFDLQLSSDSLVDGEGLSRMSTYRAFGNDGNHYNLDINAGNNTYYPADIPRSNALAAALRTASDHIPVVSEYQIPAVMAATLPAEFGRVIRNAPVTVTLEVSNAAAATIPTGADELDFSATASGGLSGVGSGTAMALGPAVQRAFSVNTSAAGPVTGSVLVSTTSEAAENASILLPTSGTVVLPANPSFSSVADEDARTVRRVFALGSGIVSVSMDIYNYGWSPAQAALDLDGVDDLAAPFTSATAPQAGITSGAGVATVALNTDEASAGLYTDTFTVTTSDENIPGAGVHPMSATLTVRVRRLPGDVDNDCDVELSDLTMLLAAYGACGGQAGFPWEADIDNSGCIDLGDLSALLADFGRACP